MHITFISTQRIGFRIRLRLPQLFIINYSLLIVPSKRCRCRNDGINSGVGVPPNRKYQADNLAKLWQEVLSVIEPIAKIFGAVSRTKA